MRSRAKWSLVAAATLLGASCGFPVEEQATPLASGDLPDALREDIPTVTTVPLESEIASVWLVGEQALVEVRRRIAAPATIDDVVADLLAGATDDEQERGIRSAVSAPDAVVGVVLSRGVATVSLETPFLEIAAEDQLLAVGQLVLTLTDFRGVGSVQFALDEQSIAVPLPTGETSDRPVFREEYLPLAQS
jgi:spore germination protein GerM